MQRDIIDFLNTTRERQGSDLHLSVGAPPAARINGTIVALDEGDLDAATVRQLIMAVLTENQRSRLEKEWELDFAIQVDNLGRFRGNAHFARGNLECAFRYIPVDAPSLEDLGHSETIDKLCLAKQGLILVTGTAGSGKSTTLAAMTKRILQKRSGIVVTIEDPIEFVFEHKYALIKQRQVGTDTQSFAAAIRAAMRQDVNVIVVSEMRDLESISAAITAAETGHLVISTLHTRTASSALDRIVDVFPAAQQPQIITQLAGALIGVISQRLLPRADDQGRVMASEVLVVNQGIQSTIRDHRFEQIYGLMQIGSNAGMHTFDESFLHLANTGYITLEEALNNARHPDELKARFQDYLRAQAAAKKR